jgi:hypothetical protein
MVDEAEEDWGKKEMAITATAKNRIMIFGPKTGDLLPPSPPAPATL